MERVCVYPTFLLHIMSDSLCMLDKKTYLDLDTKKCLGLIRGSLYVYGKLIAYIGCMLVFFYHNQNKQTKNCLLSQVSID